MKKRMRSVGLLVIGYWLLVNFAYAKDITILYTGETHAMLYHCSCPKEPDGGASRRASLIKQLRKTNPNSLLLDSGGFFAGGVFDEYTQNTQLDRQRTEANLKAMELMKYDAVAIGDDEFNFGREFLKGYIANMKIPFVSSNIQSDIGAAPYIIKDVSGVKVGIIGLTPLFAKIKTSGIKFTEPKTAVKQAIENVKKEGASIIILLSHLGESDDLSLVSDIKGIDVLISGHMLMMGKEVSASSKVGSTLILRPSWQGRRLGKAVLTVEDSKIIDYKVEELRLSDKISDDAQVLSVLPQCFSDFNCQKEGSVGTCQNAGSLNSQCLFNKADKVPLLVITPKECTVCAAEKFVDFLKKQFPGITPSYLYYPDAKAAKIIKNLGIKGLPAYLLDKKIAKDKGFDAFKENLEEKGDYYYVKYNFTGISYFQDRPKIKGRLDLFLSLYDKDMVKLLDTLKEFKPDVHFLAIERDGKFETAKGNLEIEDNLRGVCVKKYYPEAFWDYISCRAKSVDSSWWESCLDQKLDPAKVKVCAMGQEGASLLRENIQLNKGIEVMFGPTYLVDNQEAFGSQGVPTKEDFKKLFKR